MSGQQQEVVRFLTGGALGGSVERIDTHGAIVLLAGERAWKLKRAVRFSFMDFSTLERREAALRAELALNRRTAPTLYRRVLAVTREPEGGRLALAGAGEPVEWLLEMARFPAEAQLDRVAERGGLDAALAEALALTVQRFHEAAERRPDLGGLAGMAEVVEGNAGDLAGLAPAVLDRPAVAALNTATRAELQRRAELLEARRRAGLVRHCHGDLHLANIVLLEGRPVLFDCIEFDERIACCDVLYDLAFLIMDLVERQLSAQAWALLQAYHECLGEDAGLALLPLFVSVRAAVRAKISGFGAAVLEGEARAAKVAAARGYLDLAALALKPAPPRLLAVGGRSGAGKTSVARALAPALGAMPGASLLRTDVVRKRLLGRPPSERLPPAAYTPEVSAQVFATVAERARVLLTAGRTVIADGVYGEPAQRHGIEAVAAGQGVPFRAVWLEAPAATLEERVAARRGDASDADVAVVRRQAEGVDESLVAWPRVAAGGGSAEVAAAVRRVWES